LSFSQHKQVKIAKLQYQITENDYQYNQQRLLKEYQNLLDQYFKLKQKLEYYETSGLELAQKIIQNSSNLYHLGQIDYVEYLQNMEEAYTIQQEYLNTLNDYNSVVITLNYYTYK